MKPVKPVKKNRNSPASLPKINVDACVAGDKDAWRLFMHTYESLVRRAARWTLAHREGRRVDSGDVDDVVQEVLFRLVRSSYRLLATYDPSRISLGTWLCVVARSTALDYMRNKQHGLQISLDECDETYIEDTISEASLDIPENILTNRQKDILHLAMEKDMSPEDIARSMDIHPQTVRSMKHTALLRLREYYSKSIVCRAC